jgi:hypothetical protein
MMKTEKTGLPREYSNLDRRPIEPVQPFERKRAP